MKAFEYLACATLDQALAALDGPAGSARVLAGGTDLLLELRRPGGEAPRTVVDVSCLAELAGIAEVGGAIRIGPLTTHAELSRSPLLKERAGFLAAAAAAVGSPQIRNRGTIGGNIMNAATCADTVPPLVALGARLTLRSLGGSRVVEVAEFFEKPYVTRSRPGELLVAIEFPPLPPGTRSAFVKLGRRNALSISRLSVAASLGRDAAGVITAARVVPGAALPVWKRVTEAEALLVGRQPSPELFASAGHQAAEAMIAMTGRRWSTEYKEPVLAVLVRRALEACCAVGCR
jgi:CO/xanthine dehydrogenase FAD-binding subunit